MSASMMAEASIVGAPAGGAPPEYQPKIYPLADEELSAILLKAVYQAQHLSQLRKGANETVKALNKGIAEVVVLAADADPLDVVLHIPSICEEKRVVYAFVPSKSALGRACGVVRPVVSCTITHRSESELASFLADLKIRLEQILI